MSLNELSRKEQFYIPISHFLKLKSLQKIHILLKTGFILLFAVAIYQLEPSQATAVSNGMRPQDLVALWFCVRLLVSGSSDPRFES